MVYGVIIVQNQATKKYIVEHLKQTTKSEQELIGCLMYLATHTQPLRILNLVLLFLLFFWAENNQISLDLSKETTLLSKENYNYVFEFNQTKCWGFVSFRDTDFWGEVEDRQDQQVGFYKLVKKKNTVALSTIEAE